jgi:hypothetical protein
MVFGLKGEARAWLRCSVCLAAREESSGFGSEEWSGTEVKRGVGLLVGDAPTPTPTTLRRRLF